MGTADHSKLRGDEDMDLWLILYEWEKGGMHGVLARSQTGRKIRYTDRQNFGWWKKGQCL